MHTHIQSKTIIIGILLIVVAISTVWYTRQKPPATGDWQEQLKVPAVAEFHGNEVTIHNVRNFRYGPTESDMHPNYYDKTYDLTQIKKVWFTTEPFNQTKIAAHTFVSFEFTNGDFLAITIEARKTKEQTYSIMKGLFHSYPLMYIPADERDITLLRANIRKDNMYVYPVKLSKPENGRLLLEDMLYRMNDLAIHPVWYNTLWANCTSSIAYHVNRIDPGRISPLSWQLWLTSSSDALALKAGLLDTTLPIAEARKYFYINRQSQQIDDVPNYSQKIRQFSDNY